MTSAIRQHESITGTHMSPSSWTSLTHPTVYPLSRWLQSPSLSYLSHRVNSHWLSILYVGVCMFSCHYFHSSRPFLPPPTSAISLFSMSVPPCKMLSIFYLIKQNWKSILFAWGTYMFSMYLFTCFQFNHSQCCYCIIVVI